MKSFKVNTRIAPFINDIILLETDINEMHKLPFYADGYPGILYSETQSGVILQPHNKLLPDFFLYGQTIEPIQLEVNGPYKMIVFQLYPFATRLLINVAPKEINDECYDLNLVEGVDTQPTIQKLKIADSGTQINIISEYVLNLIKNSASNTDNTIRLAVSTIINTKGVLPINTLRDQLYITERTFERKFLKEIGVTPKQFSRIIQFSYSYNQIQESDYTKLTNIAFDNGYADQSHFTRTFKKFTGATPKEVLSKID